MSYNQDEDSEREGAARHLAKMLLGEARRLALQFESILTLDAAVFHEATADLAALVEGLRSQAGPRANAPARGEVERPFDSGNTESFILDIIGIFPEGASVENIYNGVVESGAAMSREALTVRLHRMLRAGKITRPSQGHYALPRTPVTPFRRSSM
ncbi:hypothetical protein CCR94_18710 [Rhodoblastus sphagnicola]|uniref:Uncharacterized protein n=1 Tax=Rhodoblastus sphagnicola TaxID=333368 RepID=A0A2S6N0F0_9HYPH|nr:hypothetical protein [Rhodoblastus sphagnicola]MBB4198566.1 hypothetical protein [Rhodoblastus sphagnicola]PPQ28082.1 hypothetical protein CCR94_18710 [Rhodoblastus sphagnicola]